MSVELREVVVADEPAAWHAAGFAVAGDAVALGPVTVRLAGRAAGSRIARLGLAGVGEAAEADGLPLAPAPAAPPPAAAHANGARLVDHVVAVSPDLDRTVAALRDAGLDLRRVREEPAPAGAPRQAFFHLGTAVLEVVQEPAEVVERGNGRDRPASFWGLALVCDDLDAAAALLGERAAPARPAVQPGRRIMPLRRSAGLALAVAFMSPRSREASARSG